MKKENLFIVLLLLTIIHLGCYKDMEVDNGVKEIEIPEVIIDHNLVGNIITEDKSAPELIQRITYNEQELTLRDADYFYVEAMGVNKYYENLTIKYHNVSFEYHTPYIENETNYNTFILPSKVEEISHNASQPLTKEIGDHQSIRFIENKFSKANSIINQKIELQFAKMNYTSNGQYPGGMIVQDNDGELSLLIPSTYFMIYSTDFDQFEARLLNNGEHVYIYANQASVWRPLIKNNGEYEVQENGLYAIGSHTSYHTNTGTLKVNDVSLNGDKFISKSSIINQYHQTTNKGKFIAYVPEGEEIDFELHTDCNRKANKISVINANVDIGEVNLTLENYHQYFLQAKIKDCSNLPLATSIIKISTQDETSLKYIDSDDTNINFSYCGLEDKVSIEGVHLDGQTGSQRIEYLLEDTIKMYHIHICNELKDEYASVNIDGENSIMIMGQSLMLNDKIVYMFESPDNDLQLEFYTRNGIKNSYDDNEINVIIEGKNFGNKGYLLDCGTSNTGCGFETFQILEFGQNPGDYIRGYYKGRFWMKTFNPVIAAGYKDVEGMFHVKRNF